MPSRELPRERFGWILRHELRELGASRAWWLMLAVSGALVAHALATSIEIYAEASGGGGGASALSAGLRPLEGIVVPVLGAYDLAATLLFPFVVIRVIGSGKQTRSLAFMLQAPVRFGWIVAAKGAVLLVAWLVALVPGVAALLVWRHLGGHLYPPETLTVLAGYVLRGLVTIGVGAAAAGAATSASSAAIVALTATIGTWALDYAAAARGGWLARLAAYTPSSALRLFEIGDLRAGVVAVLCIMAAAGLAVAAVWMRAGDSLARRSVWLAATLGGLAIVALAASRWTGGVDVTEDRRNSFAAEDEAALARIRAPLVVTARLSPEDPRAVDLERGVWARLRHTLPHVEVRYDAADAAGRTGLFAPPDGHYGEIWYDLGGRRALQRSSTDEIVLETIYALAGERAPARTASAYPGYPLVARAGAWPWALAVGWTVVLALAYRAARW